MNRWSLWSCAIVLVLAAEARAEEPYFLLDAGKGYWGNDGCPDALLKMDEVSKGGYELKCVAFSPKCDWVFLFGGNGYYTSNVDLPACKKLVELQKGRPANFKCVAFSPQGGCTIFWDTNGNWTDGEVPDAALKRIAKVAKQGGELRSIAYGPKGAWVLSYNKHEVAFEDVSQGLAERLRYCIRKRLAVQCVAFIGDDWICLTDNGWWTSNADLPCVKGIAQAGKDQKPRIKWAAVAPRIE